MNRLNICKLATLTLTCLHLNISFATDIPAAPKTTQPINYLTDTNSASSFAEGCENMQHSLKKGFFQCNTYGSYDFLNENISKTSGETQSAAACVQPAYTILTVQSLNASIVVYLATTAEQS